MVKQQLPDDFKEFLKLLIENKVDYLLIGGYAVGYYGYPRTTADMDIWIMADKVNAEKIKTVFTDFGMVSPQITPDLFLEEGNIVRMGLPPVRIEILNSIDGVSFDDCYTRREEVNLDGILVNMISLGDLKKNKKASGRHKDLDDLEHL